MEENTEVVPAEAAEEVQVEEPAEEVVVEPVEGDEPLTIPEPKKKTAAERIAEITRARREAERDAAHWREVALSKTEREPEPAKRPVQQGIARPELSQFNTTEEYEDALFEWRDKIRDARTAEARQRDEEATALKNFNKRADKLRAEYEDFDEVVEAPVFTPVMRQVVAASENGPEIAYFLGRPENHATAERIMALPTAMQPYEIGKLETQILLAKKVKKVPGAPDPIKPVGMGGGGNFDESKMSDDEWFKYDQARRLERIKNQYKGG